MFSPKGIKYTLFAITSFSSCSGLITIPNSYMDADIQYLNFNLFRFYCDGWR